MGPSFRQNRWLQWALGSGSASGPARRSGRRARDRGRRRHRPEILALEDRQLLSGFVVTKAGDCPPNDLVPYTLRWAVAQADAATTPGAASIAIEVSGPITLEYGALELTNEKMSIVNDSANPTATISGNNASNVFVVGSGVNATLTGLTITQGKAAYGGGIGEDGGFAPSTLTLNNCTITGNSASNVGGGVDFYGTATLNGCTITGNSASGSGGGLQLGGAVTLYNCLITANSSAGDYGGVSAAGTNININDCTISGNSANSTCGGLGVIAVDNGTATVAGCTISGNTAGTGGGLVTGGPVNIANCTINGNTANYGAGLFDVTGSGTATVTGCTISGNTAGTSGGGLDGGGPMTLAGCTIADNSAVRDGGGLWNVRGTTTFTDCTISGNFAGRDGGGVDNYFDDVYGTVNLGGCTVSGNTAGQDGGGLYNDAGKATLSDCTISGNTADVTGGGMWTSGYSPGEATLTACTISANSAGVSSGGLDNERGGLATLTDTIVAGNTVAGAASDIGGGDAGQVTGSDNLIGPGGSGGIAGGSGGNIVLTSLATLGLAPLGDYGGPTQTMALESGSAAVGKGSAMAGITTDQRGFPLDSPNPDIGAFQTQPGGVLVVNMTGDVGGVAGKLDLREAVNLADVVGGMEDITFNPTVFATPQTITLTQGSLKLTDPTGTIEIGQWPSPGVIISGGGTTEVFQVASAASAYLQGLTITGGNRGGLVNDGTLTLVDCTISGNSSAGLGGGLVNDGTAMLTLTDCTVSGNTAFAGGGLYTASGPGTLTITGCTIAGNLGGGLNDAGSLATLTDTIVASNTTVGGGPSDIAGAASWAVSGTYNLVGPGGSGGIAGGVEGNIILTSLANLGLAALGNYGGPTQTMALEAGSAAIGAGIAVAGVNADQRGEPCGPAVDIGAFQVAYVTGVTAPKSGVVYGAQRRSTSWWTSTIP